MVAARARASASETPGPSTGGPESAGAWTTPARRRTDQRERGTPSIYPVPGGRPPRRLHIEGTAVAVGEWRGLIGFVLVVLSFLLKSRMEEARMAETFADYADYWRHTAALIPGIY